MAAFTEENVEAILAVCGKNAAAIAEALSECFDGSYDIAAGDSGIWSSEALAPELHGPGLVALIEVDTQALAVLIPQSLPLPDWYRQPNTDQAARLETLAAGWSKQLLPGELTAKRCKTLAVDDLAAAAIRMKPAESAATLTLQASDAGDSSESAGTKLLVVWPLEQPNFEPNSRPAARSLPDVRTGALDPLGRLRRLPVQVSVRLVEKKIPMSQLLGIAPGMLITFNKSCDDLLDLYVNNARYGRGEAVKIGENFGLKIDQIGVANEPKCKIIDAGM